LRRPSMTPGTSTDVAIHVANLTRRFGRTWALKGASFRLPAGACLLVLGPNGAGKSTLVGVLSTLLRPTSGSAHVFGRSVTGHAEAVRRSVGVLTHEPLLFRHLSVVENLRLFGRLFGLAGLEARLQEVLGVLGLAGQADEAVGSLSHGNARRAALARALLHRPRLLLLDEPFSGLDEPGRAVLRDLLQGLHEQGVTILLTAHDLQPVAGLPDAVGVLAQGELRGFEQRSAWPEADIRRFYSENLRNVELVGEPR